MGLPNGGCKKRSDGCLLVIICLLVATGYVTGETATDFLNDYNENISDLGYNVSQAAWIKSTNITTYNSEVYANASRAYTEIISQYRKRAKVVDLSAATQDEKRQLKLLLATMTSSDQNIVKTVIEVGGEMENIYSKGCIQYNATIMKSIKTTPDSDCLTLDNYLNTVMAKSRDPKELLYVWKKWRDATGPKLKSLYKTYVDSNNIGARENGYEDAGDYKRKRYEVNDLKESAEAFWLELEDFYEELHAYVRHRLIDHYPGEMEKDGAIPAHLLGNMWAQSWENIFEIVSPYNSK